MEARLTFLRFLQRDPWPSVRADRDARCVCKSRWNSFSSLRRRTSSQAPIVFSLKGNPKKFNTWGPGGQFLLFVSQTQNQKETRRHTKRGDKIACSILGSEPPKEDALQCPNWKQYFFPCNGDAGFSLWFHLPRKLFTTPVQGGLFAAFCEKIGDPLKKESFTTRGSIIFPPKVATRPLCPLPHCPFPSAAPLSPQAFGP